MTDKLPDSDLPIRRTTDFLPNRFQTTTNAKFFSGSLDPFIQPGLLEKTVGYLGRKYGKTYNSKEIYLDDDNSLRSKYQLEPGIVTRKNGEIDKFYDYLDFKNQLKYFDNNVDRDDLITDQDHYTWDPPIDWDKFVNFREYFWLPGGPPSVKILGQNQEIISTYKVRLGLGSTWIFTPDGLSNNPILTLYRGQTYRFQINAPDNGFIIRTAYDTNSLAYNPDLPYSRGQIVLFDGKLWRAKVNISITDGSTINEESEDWEYLEPASFSKVLDYDKGVTNNGIIQGTLTFDVPLDAPDVLFYQSLTDINRFGKFLIADIESNTKIDVEKEILGKKDYLSSNGVQLTNGMIVRFEGQVSPQQYSEGPWLVEGVGNEISLINFQELVPSLTSAAVPEILFDNSGFDTEPFDDASLFPGTKDYIVINRASQDSNPWSRYNRWFHRSVIDFSHRFNGTDFDSRDEFRAKRPIIEFKKDLRLFNHGFNAKKSIDFIDNFTDDVFSIIEGSQGYIIDGEQIFQGARILFTADTDRLANNRIYQVNFINHSSSQITKGDWNVFESYRQGETVRYNGQSFSADKDSRSFNVEVTFSDAITDRFRVTKNSNLRADMAIVFTGLAFGGIVTDKIYYILGLNDENENFTEFSISESRRGLKKSLIFGGASTESMFGTAAFHPTDTAVWRPRTSNRQISLIKVEDTEPNLGDCVLVKRGDENKGLMYHYDGKVWKLSQRKTSFNQSPRFEILDENLVSFGDPETYPVSSFRGSTILSYKQGNSTIDPELGFSLSYLNINNVGDINFNFDYDQDIFSYEIDKQVFERKISTGFYIFNKTENLGNCWSSIDRTYVQPIIYSTIVDQDTDSVILDVIDWISVKEDEIKKIIIYRNGQRYQIPYIRSENLFRFNEIFSKGDVVAIKVFTSAIPKDGYYEIPYGLEKNPLNNRLISFTLGQATDHVATGIELVDDFQGIFPGSSNLRDIDDFRNFSNRFLKHSGSSALPLFLICDRKDNIISAIQAARKAYSDFRNKFISLMSDLQYFDNPIDFVDTILTKISENKNENLDAFADSDMMGTGAFSKKNYTVEDVGIKIFALSDRFDLDVLSRKAVYVYQNGNQLIVRKDYIFNKNFGFLELLVDLEEGDEIEIREYVSTVFSFIPPTPTKLGIYKKYLPSKFIDDTYLEPIEVVQGHDGSITVAFGDYRDDVLLELEKRIYNNIKVNYAENIFNIDAILGGYYRTGSVFSKLELDNILSKQFRRWIGLPIDYSNNFYSAEIEFTYNYSNSFDRINENPLPGHWRGIYLWYYDTDRPHKCPWEMLGFSEKPIWWDDQYGKAPYTKNNLLLWEDLRDGIIRQGERAGVYDRYKRPTILEYIPVDDNGSLLSPNESRLVGFISNLLLNDKFQFGDVFPTENAWRKSSDYPFQIISALCLLRPFEFIIENFDKNAVIQNRIGQTISRKTSDFITIKDIEFPSAGGYQSSGLVNYLIDYQKFKKTSIDEFIETLRNIDVNLSSRLSGFVDKDQQRFVIDSKNPRSSSSSVFVPPENYDIFYNKSVVINKLSYSGLIIERLSVGYKVSGYDKDELFFKYYRSIDSSKDQLISVGGVSQKFLNWEINKNYSNGTVVLYQGDYYRANKSHFSGDSFDILQWNKLPKLPTVGAREAFLRKSFDKRKIEILEYGSIIRTEQEIADFISGYQEYLQDQGFDFSDYDGELKAVRNWELSIKEFLLWTSQNWNSQTLITLSPAANNLVLNLSFGSAEDLTERFLEYQFLRSNGTIINTNQLDVWRDIGYVKVSTADSTDGIYYASFNIVVREHVVVFSDRTVFNDVLYDKTAGYRQERIKFRGFRTLDWQGDLVTPGFVLDNVKIDPWQPYRDYRLGDIVEYESRIWTSLENQNGADSFNFSLWTKADRDYDQRLIPNFDFKINQFSDFYNSDEGGVGSSQRDLARHLLAYQPRNYLENLAEDDVTQFKIYQGFIREKGTINSVNKIFDKLSRSDSDSIDLFEEWAFQVGRYGGSDQTFYVEFELEKTKFNTNPQLLIINPGELSPIKVDQYYRINRDNFSIAPIPFSQDIFPKSSFNEINRSAGYVNPGQVDKIFRSIDELLLFSPFIDVILENEHLWMTFEKTGWQTYRFNNAKGLGIRQIDKLGSIVILTFNRKHEMKEGEIFGIRGIQNLNGFYQIISTTAFTVEINVLNALLEPEFDGSSISFSVFRIYPARFARFSDVDLKQLAMLKSGSKLWIDSADQGKWQVLEKISQYLQLDVKNIPLLDLERIGTSVAYAESLKQSLVGVPSPGYVLILSESLEFLTTKQWLSPRVGGDTDESFESFVNGSFGEVLSISPDDKILAIGVPRGSGFLSNYKGDFDSAKTYTAGSIVYSRGKLWTALQTYPGDGSTYLDSESGSWEICRLIEAFSGASSFLESGPFEQGAVFIYRQDAGFWKFQKVILSPRMETGEKFGSAISIAVSGNRYFMAVSAPGAVNSMGRVYLFVYENGQWKTLEDQNYQGTFDNQGITIPVTKIATGRRYTIKTLGNTDFTQIGAESNTIGESFISTGNGSGTGEVLYSFYPKDSIVWWNNRLWKATEDFYTDGSSFPTVGGFWDPIDNVSILSSLPSIPAYKDDGSTISGGILTDSTYILDGLKLVELIKEGDQFGSAVSMNRDGSLLTVGAPFADGIFFSQYKGQWNPLQEYRPGDVIRYVDPLTKTTSYRVLLGLDDPNGVDSSKNDNPEGLPWVNIGDSAKIPSGKAFVYKRTENDSFELIQTITADTLSEINQTGSSENISSGDNFGQSIDMDSSGNSLIISSPNADINFASQGAVYHFRRSGDQFYLRQKLESYEEYPNEFFGSSLAISQRGEKIVVGASNTRTRYLINFDGNTTSFDRGATGFFASAGETGQVYVFENKDGIFILAEKLDFDVTDQESFGAAVDCSRDVVLVGSPTFRQGDLDAGRVRLFKRNENVNSWKTIAEQEDLVDLSKIKNINLYDFEKNLLIGNLDVIDHFKNRILGIADQAITFKTLYDPAFYTYNEENPYFDRSVAWFDKHVGEVWWDLSTVKFLYHEQDDESFRLGSANRVVEGSSIDVYEWVETELLPSEWAALADTLDGISQGISGVPKYPRDTVYSKKVFFSRFTGEELGTKYYYWVKNPTLIPKSGHRKISVDSISSLISNPESSGIAYATVIDSNKIVLWNVKDKILSGKISVNIEYNLFRDEDSNPIHNEYQLLTEGVKDSLPSPSLELKWLDSLIGYDRAGNKVPDENLPEKQKYGLSFRPRQSIFKDRISALTTSLRFANKILERFPFTDSVNFERLSSFDSEPSEILNEYDFVVDRAIDLQNIGTSLVRRPILTVNIIDGEIDSINIVDPGVGYRNVPNIEIEGDGAGARVEVSINNEGAITSPRILFKGKNYTSAIVKIRNFSVLVRQDETFNNFWAIYAWDDQRRTYIKSKVQSFDVRRYWSYIDWYENGFSPTSKIIRELESIYQESTITTKIGDLIRIKEYGSGGWALLERVGADTEDPSTKYRLVGRQKGTIEIDIERLIPKTGIGLDTIATFDSDVYDVQPTKELRIIYEALKSDIFVDDLSVEWNKIFFSSIRTSFVQFENIDWAFKTSFLNAIHNVGELEQRLNYKNDNLVSYKNYLEEVKPFRSIIREYTSRYNYLENNNTDITDFDNPPAFSVIEGKIVPIRSNDPLLNRFPRKVYRDNNSYSVIGIEVFDQGEEYVQPPTVLIQGDGKDAEAQAYISNGRVVAVEVVNQGTGYTSAPEVFLVGGNGSSDKIAKAAAIIGANPVRTFDLGIKFDRISKNGRLINFVDSERFVASGLDAVFVLKFAPTKDKNRIFVRKNEQIVLSNEYEISLFFTNENDFTLLQGRIIFDVPPLEGDIIEVSYDRNPEYLDAVNRIDRYYAPTEGMIGKQLPQLMTGIDYGGVEIQGTTFDVTGGWDALPWFSDSWDSVELLSDFYYVADGSTAQIDLPEAPELGQMISIYIKRAVPTSPQNIDTLGTDQAPIYILNPAITESRPIRIDDPNYGTSSAVTNPDAVMPTFIGDGVNRTVDFYNDSTESPYIVINPGDTLIFRPFESDGAAIINDPNIMDTEISGGSLNSNSVGIYRAPNTVDGSYATAAGITPEEIILEGGKFIGPDQVPAPEENVPGQVLESVSIKVFHTRPQGAAPLMNRVYVGDGEQRFFNIGLTVFENKSIMVYVNKQKIELGDQSGDYQIDFVDSQIEFLSAPLVGDIIEIISIGIGGVALLDYQEFVGDGDTNLFLTSALFSQIRSVLVSVDGVQVLGEILNSSDFVDIESRVMVRLAFRPAFRQVVKIVCLGEGFDQEVDSLIRINEQSWEAKRYSNIDLHRTTEDSTLNDGRELANVDLLELDGRYKIIQINQGGEEYISTTPSDYIPDGIITEFSYARQIVNPQSIAVYLNGQEKVLNEDYTVDLSNNRIIFNTAPTVGSSIEIKEQLLIYKEDISGDQDLIVEVSSVSSDVNFTNFATNLSIKNQIFGLLSPNGFVNLERSSATSSLILEYDQSPLVGPDIIRVIYDGSNNTIIIGTDPEIPSGSATLNDIELYINNVVQPAITVYTFSSLTKTLVVNQSYLSLGDEIRIVNNFAGKYFVTGNNIQLIDDIVNQLIEGSSVKLTWFNEYPSFDLISDQYVGGQNVYKLKRKPIAASYVWVYVNNIKLTKDVDFSVDVFRGLVALKQQTAINDQIKIIEFGDEVWTSPNCFEIFKDMLNVHHYKRFSDNSVFLTRDLNYFDEEIFVNDTSFLSLPYPSRNIPGTVIINEERIEYFQKTANSLRNLRRGSLGTAVKELHMKGSKISDASANEAVPYRDTQEKYDFYSDGSSLLIGPLDFVPKQADDRSSLRRDWRDNWFRGQDPVTGSPIIPEEYGPCDEVEVFAAGIRLKKDPMPIYDEDQGFSSPAADRLIEAEFSVDGSNPYIRLTKPVPAGLRITVIRKLGKIWYDRGNETASSGKTFHKNDNPIVRFILAKNTSFPE
jgi:hypothetical protein